MGRDFPEWKPRPSSRRGGTCMSNTIRLTNNEEVRVTDLAVGCQKIAWLYHHEKRAVLEIFEALSSGGDLSFSPDTSSLLWNHQVLGEQHGALKHELAQVFSMSLWKNPRGEIFLAHPLPKQEGDVGEELYESVLDMLSRYGDQVYALP